MAFDVNNFLVNMIKDGARPNLFEIEFADAGANFSIRAEATAIPGSRVGVARTHYFGREFKFAGNRVFDDWTVQVLLDEPEYKGDGPRAKLERWMDDLNSHTLNTRKQASVSPSAYQKDAKIIHWSKDGLTKIAEYKMRNAFPIDVSAVNLAWNANDQIETFSVTFALQWWESDNST